MADSDFEGTHEKKEDESTDNNNNDQALQNPMTLRPPVHEENDLSNMLEKLNLSNISSSPVPSTSTGVTDHDSFRRSLVCRNLYDTFSTDSPNNTDNQNRVSFVGCKRRKSRNTDNLEWKRRRIECVSKEKRLCRKTRRNRQFKRAKSLSGSNSTTSVEMPPSNRVFAVKSEPQIVPHPENVVPILVNTNNRPKLRPKRKLKVTFNLPEVVPVQIDPDQHLHDEDSNNTDANTPRYQNGSFDNTEHKT